MNLLSAEEALQISIENQMKQVIKSIEEAIKDGYTAALIKFPLSSSVISLLRESNYDIVRYSDLISIRWNSSASGKYAYKTVTGHVLSKYEDGENFVWEKE
jgi:hypothetical protein